jgi:hypothetical protein
LFENGQLSNLAYIEVLDTLAQSTNSLDKPLQDWEFTKGEGEKYIWRF